MVKDRHREVPASYLILIKDGKILLMRRCNTGYMDGKYGLPAGHVEEGESYTQCCVREAKEEIGIVVAPESLKFAHIMHRFSGKEWEQLGYRIDAFFTSENWQDEIRNMEPNKCDDLSWFDLNSLPDNIIPYIRQALEYIKDKKFYSEFGWRK